MGPRVGVMNGAEVTIDSPAANDCREMSPDLEAMCTVHIDGQHVSEGAKVAAGSWLIKARWPIAPAKPSRVEPGQVWRCVGVEGELVARERVEFAAVSADIGLAPVEAPDRTTVRAREVDMLGLKEWTFERGPR